MTCAKYWKNLKPLVLQRREVFLDYQGERSLCRIAVTLEKPDIASIQFNSSYSQIGAYNIWVIIVKKKCKIK